ncbi:MAG: DUF7948 domain-containing protein [Chloroflexaceae bacterium]
MQPPCLLRTLPPLLLRLSFPGANPHPRLEPFEHLETAVNYFLGNDPAHRRTDVPVYTGVRYVELYPGVDLEVREEEGRLTPRLVCRTHCSASALADMWVQIDGAEAIALLPAPRVHGAGGGETLPALAGSEDGGEGLLLTTAVGQFTLPLFQVVTADGAPLAGVGGSAAVAGNRVRAPFAAAALCPDSLAAPQGAADLLYVTFLRGSEYDYGNAIAVDASGAAYVTGDTSSADFPTTAGAFDRACNGDTDTFVAKMCN